MTTYAYTDEPCPTCGYALLETGRCTGRIRAPAPPAFDASAGTFYAALTGTPRTVWRECPNSLAALLQDPGVAGSVESPPSGVTVAGRPPAP